MASRVQIVIEVDSGKAEAAVGKVRSAIDGLGGTTVKTTREGTAGFGLLNSSMIASAATAGAVALAVSAAVKAVAGLVAESTLLAAKNDALAASTEALGRVYGVGQGLIRQQQQELEKLRFSEEGSITALNRLIGTRIDLNKAQELGVIAQAASRVANEDVARSFERVVSSIETSNSRALQAVGISVDFKAAQERLAAQLGVDVRQLTDLEKTQANVEEATSRTADAMRVIEAVAGTNADRWQKLGDRLDRVKESIGDDFQDEFAKLITLLEKVVGLTERWSGALNGIVETIEASSGGLADLAETVAGIATFFAKFFQSDYDTTMLQATFQNLSEGFARVANDLKEHGEKLDLQVERRGEQTAKILAERAKLLDQINAAERGALVRAADEITAEVLRTGAVIEKLQEIREKAPALREEADRAIANVQDAGTRQILAILQKQTDEEIKLAERAEAEVKKIRAKATEELVAEYERRAQVFGSILAGTIDLERQNAADSLDAFGRIELTRLQRLEELARTVQAEVERTGQNSAELQELAARTTEAINQRAAIDIQQENQRIFDEQARLIDRNAQQFELFWDRVTRGAKSTADFLSNLWNELGNQFRRLVLQSVAQWAFGQRQIQATAGGFGGAGGFTGLLGAIFGTPGIATARTPPFVSSFAGGGIPAAVAGSGVPGVFGGAGAGAGGIPSGIPGLGSAGIGGFGGALGGQAGGVNPALLGLLLGVSAGQTGRPGLAAGLGIGGVLGGVALSGAAAGAAGGIGGLAGAGVGLLGFLSNPVGLAILGGVAGVAALVGVIQRGRKKEQAAEVANKGFEKIREQVEAYEAHRASFDQTISLLNSQWAQMEAAWRQIGGSVGSNSIRDQRKYFDEHVQRVEQIERERQRRGTLISNLPLPQFATGGPVGPLGGVVHPGEFVIRREAVEQTGVPMLERINQGAPGGGGPEINIHINAIDSQDVRKFLLSNGEEFKRAMAAWFRQARGEFGLR